MIVNDALNLKGRGAQINTRNRFDKLIHERRADFLEHCAKSEEEVDRQKTNYLTVYPKSIVNKITSPDVGMAYSLNPYQGCEHGCIYCYARNSHEYWGFSAGVDFERQIMVKQNAHKLLETFITRKSWSPQTIVLSGNTDCYQPAERKFKLTRRCLEMMLKYKHPVGIITKNALILRDLDILKELAKHNLVVVNFSVTTIDEKTRRVLEPRTASVNRRLKTIKTLSEHGIPVRVMLAPIIPGINSHEILKMAKAVSEHGALGVGHTIVRLNGAVREIFTDWIYKAMPDKANKVLNQIKACHGNSLNESRFKVRMRGEGPVAEQINNLMTIAKARYFKNKSLPTLSKDLFNPCPSGQLRLF